MQKIKDIILTYFGSFYKMATGAIPPDPRYLFFFFSWSFAFLFFAFFVLAGKNPFSLLKPFSLFNLPRMEGRIVYTIFISDGETNQIATERLLPSPESEQDLVHRIAREVGAPPYSTAKITITPKKLLTLENSLLSVWFRNKDQDLILHWKREGLEKEIRNFRLPRYSTTEVADEEVEKENYYSLPELQRQESEESIQRRRDNVLLATFKALDASLFANLPNLKRIHHRIDGNREDWKTDFPYSFKEPIERN